MIGIFKTAFKNAIGSRILPLETLITLAKESEAICNSRPLTYVTDEVDHIPLRPIDFTRPTSRLASPRFLEDDDEWKPSHKTRDDLIKDWKFGLDILNKFWNKWSNEYLKCLRERHQASHPHPTSFQKGQPKCGDYVLIQEKDQKRGTWKIGQICDSSDKYTRSVQVKLPSKRTITRPINLICPFEIVDQTISKSTTNPYVSDLKDTTTNTAHSGKSQRNEEQALLPNAMNNTISRANLPANLRRTPHRSLPGIYLNDKSTFI
ncbi:unnamed protein product [Nippostrongylus brasiliensis]|uniref:DUF5641 domain-containing protein n=1 Tax=Nippostrongylus brasiliensis TaxID=27835 RepID=A0A0N4YA67_NIPBR|nr:unnamed protein product [Nippostrongylus brasiliensis]